MNGKSAIVKFSLIIIIIVVAFLGYRFFFASTPTAPAGLLSLAPAGISGETDQASADDFVVLLSSLEAIDLNDLPRVLTLINGLEDFSTDLKPQIPGRANPFAPIGVGGGVAVEPVVATTTAANATSTKK
jgi:hypothetical protein